MRQLCESAAEVFAGPSSRRATAGSWRLVALRPSPRQLPPLGPFGWLARGGCGIVTRASSAAGGRRTMARRCRRARGPLRCRPHRVLVRGRWPWPPPAAGARPGWPAPRGGNRGEAARPPPQPGRRPARCTGRPPPRGPAPAAAGNSPAPRKGRSRTWAPVTGSKSPRTGTVATPVAQSTVTITAGTSHTAPALPRPNTAWPGPIGGRDARRAGQQARLLRQPFPSNVRPAGIAGPPDLLCRKAAVRPATTGIAR
jgi:hypothetical protein